MDISHSKTTILCLGFCAFVWLWPASIRAQTPGNIVPDQDPVRLRAINDLQRDLISTLADPKFSNAEIGVTIKTVKTGETIFSYEGNKALLPASNLKLVTTAAALSTLGKDFRYSTQVLSDGKIVRGVLKGDLVIRGSGDPTLGSTSIDQSKDPTLIFQSWADSLEAIGISKIEGSIIADPGYFSGDPYPLGWSLEDVPYYYAAQSSGLAFAENSVSVTVSPGLRAGAKPVFEITPESQYFEVNDLAVTRDVPSKNSDSIVAPQNSIVITRDPGENTITIQGSIDKGSQAVNEQLSVDDPAQYAATVLREVLTAHGIVVTGGAMTAADLDERLDYNSMHILINTLSKPLSEIVHVINKRSHNFYCDQVLRTLGKETLGKGDWKSGVQAVKRYLTFAGVDPDHIAMYDGSGLSRMDLFSTSDLVNLLRYAANDAKNFSSFDSSLPVMGIDGTLSSRLQGSRAAGNVHAKTGSLTGVRSLSGYLRTKDDEPLAFSIILNNYTVPGSEAQNLIDLIVLRLVNFGARN